MNTNTSATTPFGSSAVFEPKHTRPRPPLLNDENFSSTQDGGPANQPTAPTPEPSPSPSISGIENGLDNVVLGTGGAVAKYPPSLETESTLSADAFATQELKTRIESIEYLFKTSFGAGHQQGLTFEALQALDYGNSIHGYYRDLASWCKDGNLHVYNHLNAELTDSLFMHHRAKSQVTDLTGSSWCVVPEMTPPNDTAADISGTGAAFHDISRSPHWDDDADMMEM